MQQFEHKKIAEKFNIHLVLLFKFSWKIAIDPKIWPTFISWSLKFFF